MRNASEDTDITHSVFVELKHLGVKVPKVRKFKSRVPKQEKNVGKSKNKIFGTHLSEQEWVTSSDGPLPKFMFDSTKFLLKHSKEVGLFRKAGSIARQRNLRAKLEDGEDLEGSDANDVASLFKQWLRELPEPLIPHYMQDLFIKCHLIDNVVNRTAAILLTTLLLPFDHLQALRYLLNFLDKFSADCNESKMGTFNLALMMAPNIFVPTSEAPDKSSNNLVQMHAATIELLIHNAGKVGEIPSSLSIQSSIQDWRSGDELDSSGDFLDCSPSKSKKKQKAGQGQLLELFSGIKKLVGQNATPSANKLTPERHHNTRLLSPHCAAKRKADFDQQTLSKKVAATSAVDNRLIVTPKASGCNLNGGKSAERHARRKSFGLLRRKERKRQKSCKASLQSQINVTKSHAQNLNTPISKESTLQIPSFSSEFNAKPLSPLQCSFDDLLKSVNMKKANSDCYLTPKPKMFFESPKPISVSHSRLYEKPDISSPYWLRSGKTQEVLTVPVQSPKRSADAEDSCSKESLPSLHDKNKTVTVSQDSGPCSLLSDSLYELSPAFRKRSFSTGSKLIRKAAITRQEGFIMKSKAKPHFIYDDSKNTNNGEPITLGKVNTEGLKEGCSVIVLYPRSSRQGSIVRGRPNSVKSGLLSQSLKTKEDSQVSESGESKSLLEKNSPDIKNDNNFSKQCFSLNGEVQGQHLEKQDLSLITKFDEFSLSPKLLGTPSLDENVTSGTPTSNIKVERSERKLRSSARRSSTRATQKQKRKMSLPSNLAVPNSVKVQKTRNSDVSLLKSDLPVESEKLQEFSILDSSDCFKMPPPSKDSTFNISNIDCHMDDSCFKTPTQNPSGSPSSITWVSGSKFFENSPEEEDNFNKRESIALILKNKQGNVQEKVSLYDTRVRDSVYCKKRVQNCSTPYIAFSRNDPRKGTSSQKQRQTPLSRVHGSINQDKAAKSKIASHKSPIPPPPKFMVSDLDIPSPLKMNHPLKEVTNTSLGLNESRDSTPVKKGTASPDLEVVREKDKASQKRRKTGRSSYPEQTNTLVKRVTRSESSPCRRRVSKTKSAGIRESPFSPSMR